jgi:eukaryotic-like serine/threonine-protein kinase
MRLDPGTILGSFEIIAAIGAGGMGEVYKAKDTRLGRMVAIKVLREEFSGDQLRRSRFEREARAISSLNHPYICTLLDVGHQDRIEYLVMELVDGPTLATSLARGPLPPGEILRNGIEIAYALDAAHKHGIVHRDLKPSNIAVTPSGVKLLDFGVAKMMETSPAAPGEAHNAPTTDPTAEQPLTDDGRIVGTLECMAPEQLRGEAADARTDIFALGGVLYRMATGRPPFTGAGDAALIASILEHDAPLASSLNDRNPRGLDRIVQRCLAKKPAERWQSAGDVARELEWIAAHPTPEPRSKPWLIAGTAAFIALLLAVLLWLNGFRQTTVAGTGGAHRIRSLAVLPLENFSRDPEQEYFADGMTEALTTSLAQISALSVISRTSVMKYGRAHASSQQIGKELNVDALIEGSVQRSGDKVAITVQLIDAASDHHLWARSYERELRDVLGLEQDMARAIADQIRIRLTPEERMRLSDAREVDPAAYEMYLKGLFALDKHTENGVFEAMSRFGSMIEKNPDDPLPYNGMALAYIALVDFFRAPSETMPQARAAASRALQLDPNLAEAHASLARVEFGYDWDWANAAREFTRALQLKPSLARVHFLYSQYLSALGRHAAAIAEVTRSRELDPLSPRHGSFLLLMARRYDDAIAAASNAAEGDPNLYSPLMVRGLVYTEEGRFPEAIADLERASQLSDSPLVAAMLAAAYAAAARRAEAEKLLARLETATGRYACPYETAIVYSKLGKVDKAFQWLERGYRERSWCMVWLKVDPRLDPLHGDVRYHSLLRRMNFPP